MYFRRHVWLVGAACVLVVGSSIAVFVGNVVARKDAQTARQRFLTTSQGIASTLKLAIQHEEDLVLNTGATFVNTPNLTQAEFQRWTSASNTFARYPELLGVAEIVMVPASKLHAFEVQALKNPAGALGTNGTFQITPPGARPYYCFAKVMLSRPGQTAPPMGFDYCDTVLGPKFSKARDSGEGAYLPFGTGKSEEFVVGTPIYRTGIVPSTVKARRANFVGWLGTQVVPSVLLRIALAGHPQTSVAFAYIEHSSRVTFRVGSAPLGAQATTIQLHNGWRVTVYGAPTSGAVLDNAIALSLLFGGLLFSLLSSILIYVLGTGRLRALTMVRERTEKLRYQALHDSLTGLPNRTLILNQIEEMLERARRDHVGVAVIFIDLDNFKDINDSLGHAAGDQLLVAVGARLSSVLRSTDSVGRLGGDEFVVLAEGNSLTPDAEAVGQRILDALKHPFAIPASDVPLKVTASIGTAEGLRSKPEDLLRDADIAMYQAKSVGKQCSVVFAPSMQKVVDDNRILAVDLSAGIEAQQFFLLYQPTIDLSTGEITGVEALLRWRHPTRGVVMPNDFVPALEASGLIVPVGLWVLREACRQGASWHSQGQRFTVSVNISVRQLEHDRIVEDAHAALLESGFDPAKLILEITETSLMSDMAATIPRLEALKSLGMRLAVDDFGAGYSSLAYLRQFPIDIVKIDRSFVSGIVDTKEGTALVHTLVQLGKALGLETIAEGVESQEQRLQLIAEKVDTGQGFLFSRPIDARAIDRLLVDWNGESAAAQGDVNNLLREETVRV